MISGRSLILAAVAAASLAACARSPQVAAPQPGNPCSASDGFEPWDAPAPARRAAAPVTGAADGMVRLYQRALRRPELPGHGCPFEPTCSAYARGALARHGVLGLLLVVDRLFVHEHPLAGANHRTVCVDGRWRWHDPVP